MVRDGSFVAILDDHCASNQKQRDVVFDSPFPMGDYQRLD
jgi:hypothetical protein